MTTSGRFAIADVKCSGIARVERGEIEDLLNDLPGQNILLAPLNSYEARLESHPRIESVSLRRVLPNRVVCVVNEREPVALVYTDRFVEVDRHAMVMSADEYTAILDIPIITGVPRGDLDLGKVSVSPRLQSALSALELCKSYGGEFAADISELHVSERGVSIRSLKHDCVLMLGDTDYEKRLRKYFLLRDSMARRGEARMIDLRFEDQVVVRGQI
jgi:cell division septal protein FtsQ